MPIRYLIDENLRGTLAVALVRVATKYGLNVDVVQVGDELGPALGTQDSELLMWTEWADRVLISRDRRTLATHLDAHRAHGHHLAGIFLLRNVPLIQIAEYLVLVAFASEPAEWRDRIAYVP